MTAPHLDPRPDPRLDPQGFAESFRRRALRMPERPALSFAGQTLSYGEMQRQIEQMAAVFVQGGVQAGDRVAWLGLNHALILVALYACARIGAIFAPLNYRLSRSELADILGDAGTHTLVADAQHAPLIEPALDGLAVQRRLLLGAAQPGWESLEAQLAAELTIPAAVDGQPDGVVVLIYTSGTTGKPKGVMLSNRNLWTNNLNWLLASDYTSQDVTLNCAPLFHSGGLCVALLPTLLIGGHVVLQQGFEPGAFLDALARYRVTVSFAVPAMMLFASQHEGFARADLSAMRLIVAGGAPVPEPLLRTYEARGIPVSQCYGMTESSTGATFLETGRATTKLGSCGRPGMLTEVKLVDRDGRTITTPGERGEICMRGGNITPGYWQRPAETAAAIDADGWLHSGDGAYFDDEGFYYICDRLKDMVISGGENIYPAELESLLYDHPAIAEVAVIGRPDTRWGEVVVVIAVLKAGAALDLDAVLAFLAPKLARFKLPKALQLIEAMPRNPNGKLLKTELRKLYGQAQP